MSDEPKEMTFGRVVVQTASDIGRADQILQTRLETDPDPRLEKVRQLFSESLDALGEWCGESASGQARDHLDVQKFVSEHVSLPEAPARVRNGAKAKKS